MDFKELVIEDCNGGESHFKELRKIHRATMEGKIVATLSKWDDDFQLTRLQKHYIEHGKTLKFVKLDDNVIATFNFHPKKFEVDGKETSINFLEQLYILPEYQRVGLGTHLLKLNDDGKEIRLTVLKNDEEGVSFYEWLGFKAYKTDEYQTFFTKTPDIKKILKPN